MGFLMSLYIVEEDAGRVPESLFGRTNQDPSSGAGLLAINKVRSGEGGFVFADGFLRDLMAQ